MISIKNKDSEKHTLKVAVMGTGNWGSKIVRVLSACKEVELKWIVDPDAIARTNALAIAPFAGSDSHIEKIVEDVDAVAICTPAREHFKHAMDLLGRKKNVFVEKPIAMRSSDVLELKRAAETSGLALMVGHQLLFHPAFLKLKNLMTSRALGPIRSIKAERTGQIDFDKEPGVLWSYGPHDIAMILSLAGKDVAGISAVGEIDEKHEGSLRVADIAIDFSNGIKASVHLSAMEKRRRRLTVFGDWKTAVFDDTEPGGRLFLLGSDEYDRLETSLNDAYNKTIEDINFENEEPLTLELSHFVHCIKNRLTPMTGPDHAASVTEILETACKIVTEKNDAGAFIAEPAIRNFE